MIKYTAVYNWRTVLRHAWSYKLAILAAILSGVDVFMQLFASITPSVWLAIAAGLFSIAAAVSRFVAQKELP